MKLIISDISKELFSANKDAVVITESDLHHCIGCFGCWVKTPGKCVIMDGYEELGKQLSTCDELVLISRCCYGSVSPFVKNILDRSLSYQHPNFCIRNGEMHHKRRYDNVIKISAYFYGEDISERERDTAVKLIKANAVNFDGKVDKIIFLNNKEEMGSIIL